jgi:hypothetical protein
LAAHVNSGSEGNVFVSSAYGRFFLFAIAPLFLYNAQEGEIVRNKPTLCWRQSENSTMTLRSKRRRLAICILSLTLLAFCLRDLPATQADDGRLVLAFYYTWFDQNTWKSGKVPDVPLAPYNSDDRAVMARHIDQAQGAGIDALVVNWWGKGNRTEKNLKALLDVAAEKGFRIAVDFDINSPFMGGANSYADNLRHLHAVHANHPAYLRYQGRPVVFFYNVSRLSVNAWQSIRDRADPDRSALWIAEGTNLKYQSLFDGHHLYSITWPNRIPPAQTLPKWGSRVRKYNQQHGTAKIWVATVMPGYDDRKVRPNNGFARSREGGAYYGACWQAAIDSKPDWVIVNSFNEWPEGSYIEPSQAHGNLYLDLTRDWAARYKGAAFAANAPLPAPPQPTATTISPTPTPTPLPLAPTAEPPPQAVESEPGPNISELIGPNCGFVRMGNDPVVQWVVYCYSSSAGAHPLLIE